MNQKNILTLTYNQQEYQVIFRRITRSRSMRITVGGEKRITVTGPRWVPLIQLEKFWEEKKIWALQQAEKLAEKHGTLCVPRDVFLREKTKALQLVEQELEYWNQFYHFQWNRVTIRNQKTRFGSCSPQKNLSFHVAVVYLPEHLRSYLVVHELCHTKAMHHGPSFWALVEKTLPDARERARELRQWQYISSS